MLYPVICHYEDGAYWSEFPDLDGCFSQGATEQEILLNSKESLEGYIISLLELNKKLPPATSIKNIKTNDDDFVSLVECNLTDAKKSVRKNVTIPAWLNAKAEKSSINFSQVLQEALMSKLSIM